MNNQQPPKPSLTLLPGHSIGPAEILDLYCHLTGREPAPAEEAEVRELLEERGEVEEQEGG